ncbi:MAG: sulfite exporter TauE/SafE family protein [Methanobacteriaceae archaeon]
MDLVVYLLILALTGVLVGFTSGLLGVGGGFIMGPVQFFLLVALGVDPTLAIRVAFGTSLAVILPTAISGAWGHNRRGAVLLKPALLLGSTGFVGGIIGAFIATNSPVQFLRILSGIIILASALWMLRSLPENQNEDNGAEESSQNLSYLLWGFLGGLSSGLLGIGGGVIMVPLLIILLRFRIHQAIGTSMVFITLASLGGIIVYILQGLFVPGLPPYSVGYVNLVQLVALAVTSIPLAQVGVLTSHRLPEKQLRYLFILILFYISLKMMGIFEWLNLPL